MTDGKSVYTPEELFDDIHQMIFETGKSGRSLTLYERMTQKNYVDALIVSSNKAVEKTTKRGVYANTECCFVSAQPMVEMSEKQLRVLHFSSMGRVSEAVSMKRGALMNVLRLAERNRRVGDLSTRQHYEDLIIRIKEALNIR